MKYVMILFLTFFLATTIHSQTVGTDGSCDFSNIQDAIDSINSGQILVTNQKIYRENLSIHSKQIYIIGGFDNCNDAMNNIHNGGRTTVSGDTDNNGTGDDTVLKLSGTGDIDLLYLNIEDGNSNIHSGGIDIQKSSGWVNLESVNVRDNYGKNGGGIGIYNSPNTNLRFYSTNYIISNTANFFGGGIYCDGTSQVSFSSSTAKNSGVSNNTSNLNGGGVYLTNQCQMNFKAGRLHPDFLDLRGIAGNQAKLNGGGVFISGGAKLFLEPQSGRTVNISENIADSDNNDTGNGGGIFVTGSFSAVFATNSHLTSNSAYYGGAVYVSNGGGFLWGSTTQGCVDKSRCSNFKSNSAQVRGGAIYATGVNTQVDIVRTYFEYNRADIATAVYVDNSANVNIDYSIFSRNGENGANGILDIGVFHVHNDAELNMKHVTIVDNNAETAVIVTDMTAFNIDIINSIIHDASSGLIADISQQQASDFFAWNVIFHEDGGLYGNDVIVADPQFVDRAGRNFNLTEISPAIDEAFQLSSYTIDYFGAQAGWDDPNIIGNGGTFDIGAIESYASDIIFKNGMDD